jgi:hypothetical protein
MQGSDHLPNGKDLLLLCLRRDIDEEAITRMQRYNDADWEETLVIAGQHMIGPLLYQNLKPMYDNLNLPIIVWNRMHKNFFYSASRNMLYYRQLIKIIEDCNIKNIPVILLKGAHLAKIVYGNIALRPMNDIDLLVRKEDLAEINQVLIEDGYVSLEKEMVSTLKHLPPYHKIDAVCIEIHFHITEPPFSECFNIEDLWNRAQKIKLQGVEVLTLCPEDLLLHLCEHTCIQHGFDNGLISCFDIAYALNYYQEELDWEELWKRSKEWGIEKCLFLMLALTQKTLGASVPEEVSKIMEADENASNAQKVAEDLIFERGIEPSRFVARLFAEQSLCAKLKYILQRIFPAKEIINTNSNQTGSRKDLELLHLYLRRMRNLYKEHIKTIWAGLRKDPETLMMMNIQNKRNSLRDWLTNNGIEDVGRGEIS